MIYPGNADTWNFKNMYKTIFKTITSIDKTTLFFYEGITWDNWQTGFDYNPEWENKSVLSYHHYQPFPNIYSLEETISRFKIEAERLGSGVMLTEFDINVQTANSGGNNLTDGLLLNDKFLQGWIGWSYKEYSNITGKGDSLIDGETGETRIDMLKLFSRTYPRVTAGDLKSVYALNDAFTMSYVSNGSEFATEIKLQKVLFYPNGINVEISNPAAQWSYDGVHVVSVVCLGCQGMVVDVKITAK